jgi:acyl-CoA thioesterase
MKEAEILRELISTQPYLKLLGIELIDAGPGWVHEKLSVREKHLQPAVVHGGAIYSLADTGTAHAVLTLVYPGEWVTTVEQKINFLRAVNKGTLLCHSRVLHLGKRIGYCEAEVKSESGELIAKSTATMMRLEKR